MDNFEKGFRGRIIPKGEGVQEIVAEPEADSDKKKRELLQQLEETKEILKDPKLSPDRLSELWKRQRDLEKKLGLEDEEKKEPPTGVYL